MGFQLGLHLDHFESGNFTNIELSKNNDDIAIHLLYFKIYLSNIIVFIVKLLKSKSVSHSVVSNSLQLHGL